MTAKWLTATLRNGLLLGMAAVGGMKAMSAEPAGPVTFNKHVLPILQKNCQSCHRPGQIAPFSLLTYQDARPMAPAMKMAVATKKMPPWNADPKYGVFSNDRSLAQSDIDTIVAWADQGAPEGDARDRPALACKPWEISLDNSSGFG